MQPSSPLTYARAKHMRSAQTEAERQLWGALRNRSLAGLKFFRQVPLGPFIVDFICHERGLVIELDGMTHSEEANIARDERRTRFLESLGLLVYRVWNIEMYQQRAGVLEGIEIVAMMRPTFGRSDMRWLAPRR